MNQAVGAQRLPGRAAVDDVLPVDAYILPSRESWLTARLTAAEWERLLAYDCSIPTGVILGKLWRRTDRDGRWLGTYQRDLDGNLEVVFRPVVLLEPGPAS